ncbi:MAG: hypothetical protein Q9186_004314 [Xanthomendoza sp. 1 TL-2023]
MVQIVRPRKQVDMTPTTRRDPGESPVSAGRKEERSFSDFGRTRGTFRETSSIPESIVVSDSDDETTATGEKRRRGRFVRNAQVKAKVAKYSTSAETTTALRRETESDHGEVDQVPRSDTESTVGVVSASLGGSNSTGLDDGSAEDTGYELRPPGIRRFSRFRPLLESLPRHNTFLEGIEPDGAGDEEGAHRPEDIITRDAPHLVTARESGFFDTTVETGHEDMAVRVASGAVYFRWHVIEENDVRLLLVADRIATRSPLYQVIRTSCVRHQSVFQNKSMKWFKRGVVATVVAMGGTERFEGVTSTERQQVWRSIFERDPLKMAKASMPSAQRSIDLHGIYTSPDPRGSKWRRYIKTCFVWMAEDTFNYRVMRDDDETAFSNWRTMSRRRQIHSLGLGDTFDVPVRHGGMYDRDRRLVGKAYMNNPTYMLEED